MKKIYLFFLALFLSINLSYALENGMSVNVLPSGQKVIIKEVKDNNIVKIDTWINTGSINETKENSGLSHFLEHLFFKGTQKYKTGEADKILDSKGAIVNAATSKDFTHYYIQLPSKDFDLALDIHSDMLQNPMIPRKELEKERSVVIEEISKTKDSPQNLMFDNMYKLLYSKSNHPYQRNVIGEKEVIENVTREEILDYYNKFYTKDAFTTVIVGDVDKNEALKKVETAFSKNNEKNSKQYKVKYPKIKPLEKVEKIEQTMDINKTHFMMGFLAPKFENEKETIPLDVLMVMLGDGKSSILNQELKEKQEMVLSVSCGNYSQKDSGIFYIYATLEPDKQNGLEEKILNELRKIQNGEFDEKLIQKAKNIIKTDTYYSRESISNISNDLGYDFTFSKNENYYENYLKNIDKVTKEDIIKVAKKYLTLDKYAVSVVKGKELKKISNVQEKTTKQSENKLIEENKNIKKFNLKNGLTLVHKKKTTNSIIAFDIAIKGSKAIEKKPVSSMLTALSLTTGTQNFTNSQLANYLDENGIKLNVSSSNDIFSIVLQTTKENLDKAFLVLDEIINKPSFQDIEINKIKARKIQELKAVSDSPSTFVFDEFKRLAFLNTIYGQNSTYILNNINNLKRDDLIEFYSRLINPANISVAVVGDVDDDFLIKKLNDIIKPNPKGKAFSYKNQNFTPFKPTKNLETTLYKKEVQANWMALGYKICGIQNRKDIATLNVINAILGEGMSSRLFVKLREEQGLAYSVGSTLSTNVLDGAFIAYIGTNAKSIEQAKNGILKEIDILKKEMVTTKELNEAKDKIMGQFLMALETNMDEADLLSWYSTLGFNLGAFEEYKKLINEVSQGDIIETANRYFSKPYIYTVVKAQK